MICLSEVSETRLEIHLLSQLSTDFKITPFFQLSSIYFSSFFQVSKSIFPTLKHVWLHFHAIRKSTPHNNVQSIHNINANISLFLIAKMHSIVQIGAQTKQCLMNTYLLLVQDSAAYYEQKDCFTVSNRKISNLTVLY